MLEFRPLKLEDKENFESYMKIYKTITCHYSFHSLFAWKDYLNVQVSFYMNALYIKITGDKGCDPLFYYPICANNEDIHLNNLIDYCNINNLKLAFTYLEESLKDKLFSNCKDFIFENVSNNFDYIYLKDSLKSLSGKKLKNKRNFINQFKNKYLSSYSYELLSKNNHFEIKHFLDTIHDEIDDNDDSLRHEKVAAHLLLDNFEELKIFGGILKVNDEVVAFCLASNHPSANDTVVVHIERANHNYIGSSQMINYLFANSLSDDISYINREEDFGLLGLRKAKISYDPTNLGVSYNAYHKSLFTSSLASSEDLVTIKKIYREVFGNDEFYEYYFNKIYNKDYTFILSLNHSNICKRNISMATNMPFVLNNGKKITYLFALATKPKFQRQGIMKKLLNHIPLDDVILIPESEKVNSFYLNLNFKMHLRGYINTFYPKTFNSTSDIRILSKNDLKDIDELYNKTYPLNINRTNLYQYILDFHEIYGYYVDNKLIAYIFLDKEKLYICESASDCITNINILADFIIRKYNLETIKGFNSFTGKEIFYFYKGNVDSKLFVNCLYD